MNMTMVLNRYANVRTPERHVRTRLYFTSVSGPHPHSVVVPIGRLQSNLVGRHWEVMLQTEKCVFYDRPYVIVD